MSAKTELRRKVASLAAAEHHKQTHSVFRGKFRIPAWKDGDVIRALFDNTVLSRRTDKGWTGVVKAINTHKPGRFDHITVYGNPDGNGEKPANPGQCVNCNSESLWDGINKGEFF